MKKFFAVFGIVFILALAGGGYWLYENFGNLAKAEAEKVASGSLGVDVHIGSLDINFRDKEVTLGDLKIENPEGYDETYIMSVGTIKIAADTLSPERLIFNEILVDGANINLEVTEQGTNFTSLQKLVQAQKKLDTPQEEKKEIDVAIKRLLVTGTRIAAQSKFIEKDLEPLAMNDFTMNGIGVRENGIPASDAIAAITQNLGQAVMQTAMRSGYLQGMSKTLMDSLKLRYESTDAVMDKVKSDFQKAGEELKGLFGGNKEE